MIINTSNIPQEIDVKKKDLNVSFNADKIEVDIKPQKIDVSVNAPSVTIMPESQIIRESGDVPIYHGEYEVTPTRSEQTLQTHGYLLTSNVKVNPIPSNYGLITWDGSRLTVS